MNIIEKTFTTNGTMAIRKTTERIILHHADASSCTVEDIDRWHKAKGWCKIGYHFFVDKQGNIYRGREENAVGSHAYASNYNSIGICAEGKYMEETMPEAQKNALKELVAYLKEKYGITKVQAHRDVCATSCPGKNYPFTEIASCETKPAVDEKKERIKELQRLLNKLYIKKDEKPLDIDGIIGEKTNKALRRVALKNYTVNELVTFVQRRLIMNGCGVGIYGADGKYGQATANAVRKFQKEKGLTVDGIAGINTIKALL